MESATNSASSSAAELGKRLAEEVIKSTEEEIAGEAVEEVVGSSVVESAVELIPSPARGGLLRSIRLPSAIQISTRNWIRLILFSGTAVVGTIVVKR